MVVVCRWMSTATNSVCRDAGVVCRDEDHVGDVFRNNRGVIGDDRIMYYGDKERTVEAAMGKPFALYAQGHDEVPFLWAPRPSLRRR